MSDWTPYLIKEVALREIEARIAREPGLTQLHFNRALLLTEMGRLQEAKQIYIDILIKNQNQFAPFNNLGTILTELGYRKEALRVFREVAARFPNNPKGRVNLARALHSVGELKEARVHYETVLRLAPDHLDAHRGFSNLLIDLQEEKAALEHRQKGFGNQPWTTFPYRGKKEPVRILLLVSPCGGNAPIQRFLDNRIFLTSEIFADFYTSPVPLPFHQVVVNAIGDADHCDASLQAANRVLQQTTAPVINCPAKIQLTGRAENARTLGSLEGVVTPRITTISREILIGATAYSVLDQHGFTFPILLRTPGFHGGENFLRVENADGLASAVALLPGRELTVIQYLDARDGDDKIRKYRVMMIDGKLYPVHKAVSSEWKIHYFSAEMVDSFEHRAEDAAFLEDMPGVLGPRAMRALEQIRDAVALDYAGVDFSLGPEGELLLFEANATMMAPLPGEGEQWDYRRGPAQRIRTAVQEMILARAGISSSSSMHS